MPDCKILEEALQTGLVVHGLPGLSLAIHYFTSSSATTADTTTTTAAAATLSLQQLQLVAGPGITPSTVFGIGSITKTFVAIVILQLVQEGRLDLDRTALDYLLQSPVVAADAEHSDAPSSSTDVAALLGNIPNGRSATLRHLLSHQSGIPTWEFVPAWIRNARGVHLDPTKRWDSIESLTYVAVVDAEEDAAKGDATTTTSSSVAPPGERYSYSNTNYTILGHVVEVVTGQSIAHELRHRILAPFSLRSAFFITMAVTKVMNNGKIAKVVIMIWP
jgi:D-alanyl-D-alanine carboxypeptidase